jgi:integrase
MEDGMAFARSQQTSLYSSTGQRKYLTPDERARFLNAAWRCERAELRTLALTLSWTGCRISEALSLTQRCIEVEAGFIAVTTLKRRSRVPVIREIPVPPGLIAALVSVHGIDGAHPDRRLWTLSRSRAWTLIKMLMHKAGVADGIHASPKGLRHGFGLHAIRAGVPLNLVQKWLGHARMETTAIYTQALGVEEAQIAARMWS